MSRQCVLISCRVDRHIDIGEKRDAVDQRLSRFIWEAGLVPILVPNLLVAAVDIFSKVKPIGLVLSGGNDLVSLGGKHPERDDFETKLVDLFCQEELPIFGICRGLQFLMTLDQVKLEKVDGHVRTRHTISDFGGVRLREVNSYHSFAAKTLPEGWEGLARTEDGCVEWAKRGNRIQGLMWHPERELVFDKEDLGIVRDHFRV